MARDTINLDSVYVVELQHPIDVVNQDPLDDTDDLSTCSLKAYDPGKDTVLISAIAATAVLPISPAGVFSVGDILEVTEDDGTLTETVVLSIDTSAGTVTGDAVVTLAAAGNRVRAVFGQAGFVELAMSAYGTAAIGELDYGFRVSLPFDHPRMHVDEQNVDIEIRFIGDPAVGKPLNALYTVCATVKRICAE